jgi:hypothetical protein
MPCAFSWDVFGNNVVPTVGGLHQACNFNVPAVEEGSSKPQCSLACADGYASSFSPETNRVLVRCEGAPDDSITMRNYFGIVAEAAPGFKAPRTEAADLNCQPDNCVATDDPDSQLATEKYCPNGLIASGTTGNCKCTAEDPTPQTPQTTQTTQTTTTQTTTSSAVSLRVQIQAKLLLVALSTLSFLV